MTHVSIIYARGMIQVALNQVIKETRKKQGMTQDDLSKKVGVARQTVARWEGGDIIPDALNLMYLEIALQVEPGFLMRAMHLDPPKAPRGRTSPPCGAS